MKSQRGRVLLLTSYCGEDSEDCSDDFPCRDCMDMCNVAEIEYTRITVVGGFDYIQSQATDQK